MGQAKLTLKNSLGWWLQGSPKRTLERTLERCSTYLMTRKQVQLAVFRIYFYQESEESGEGAGRDHRRLRPAGDDREGRHRQWWLGVRIGILQHHDEEDILMIKYYSNILIAGLSDLSSLGQAKVQSFRLFSPGSKRVLDSIQGEGAISHCRPPNRIFQ